MIKPAVLKIGDKIAIVSPSRKITSIEIQFALSIFEQWGLEVEVSPSVFNSYHQFAGTDEERIQSFQLMLDDHEIKAIFCARGGYGASRIIDGLDFKKFIQHPKWICGYSDATVLHGHIHNLGIESLHCTMPLLFERDTPESLESIRKLLFGESLNFSASSNKLNREGNATGSIIGGNLSIINNMIGTSSDIDFKDKILFLEDLDEYLYHIDRMMVHLKRAGKLKNLAGLIVGHFSDMKDNIVPFGSDAYQIIHDAVKDQNYPVAFGFPIGHQPNNLAVVCGRKITFEVNPSQAFINF